MNSPTADYFIFFNNLLKYFIFLLDLFGFKTTIHFVLAVMQDILVDLVKFRVSCFG